VAKGHENLIPQAHVLTLEDQSNGGKKSGEVRRENGPTIYINSRKKKDKTEQEMRDDLKTGREKSLRRDSNIEKREQNARIADAQLSYYKDRYGEDSKNRPRTID